MVAGSLLVTCPMGRGVSVVDFLTPNQKALTMRTILEFFKQTDAKWPQIRTVVIDKDFAEWKAFESAFPFVKILLYQFHTISYWKKVVQKRSFNLNVAQRETIMDFIMDMIYA